MRKPFISSGHRVRESFPAFRTEIRNGLVRNGVRDIVSLGLMSDAEILKLTGFGPKMLAEIRNVIGPPATTVSNWVGEGMPA